MPRGLIPSLIFAFSAVIFFGLGNLLAARASTVNESEQIAAIRRPISGNQPCTRLSGAGVGRAPGYS